MRRLLLYGEALHQGQWIGDPSLDPTVVYRCERASGARPEGCYRTACHQFRAVSQVTQEAHHHSMMDLDDLTFVPGFVLGIVIGLAAGLLLCGYHAITTF
ncbi:hypothetical protein [Ralstonia phage phiRSL1]|uniref:Uncharacterized protein n=1 Tax=Ralstonia phage phiRSL1 TaxID=1980924 RepID=B2ZXQ2_9CAUD|nr:hypothetical protein RSL1_ORF032 [Ralstonia phage phiRSL1]BAG41477.1 hypothetical protein [Ralstonia phage phiRSL1]